MKWLKRVGIGLLLLVLLGLAALWIASEPRPTGQTGPEADALARKVETAIGREGWRQTGAVWWNFDDRNIHLWDKARGYGRVRWGDVEVLIDLKTKEGIATRSGAEVADADRRALLDKAYAKWCNDSFWLNPLVKLFDEGTTRAVVKQDDGSSALLVSYGAGGVTPGDAYLWKVDEQGMPTAWKMWVSILPIGGLEFSWERWKNLSTGAKVATLHQGLRPIEMKDVLGAPAVTSIEPTDPFIRLTKVGPASQPSTRAKE